MGRPKKEKPNRKDGCYEVKVTVGKNFDGTLILQKLLQQKEQRRCKSESRTIQN